MKTLALRAEAALLGAMTVSAETARGVNLERTDFTGERHQAAYDAIMRALSEEGDPSRPWRQRVETAAVPPNSFGVRDRDRLRVSSRYFGSLVAACPDPAHGCSYALLLAQASFRRMLYRSASSIRRGNVDREHDLERLMDFKDVDGADAVTVSRTVRQLIYHGEEVARELDAMSRVFNPDTAYPIAGPPLAASGRARKEERVLAALLQGHPHSPRVLQLRADGFTDPDRRDIFNAIKILNARALGIDSLTVDWAMARNPLNEGSAGRRDAVTARGREPGYTTRLAAIDTGITQLGRTAVSLLGPAPEPARDPEPEYSLGEDTEPGRYTNPGAGFLRPCPAWLTNSGPAPGHRL